MVNALYGFKSPDKLRTSFSAASKKELNHYSLSTEVPTIFRNEGGLNVRIILIVCLFFTSLYSVAQDIHFSQIQTVQQQLNPASTGVMTPQMRFTANYRNQWRHLGFPFVSNYLSMEGKTRLFGRPAGMGALYLHDRSSGGYLNADEIYFSLSHSFYYRNNQLVIGLQPGLVIKSLDMNSITFGSQFNPDLQQYDPNLPSGEKYLNENLRHFDLNAGILWRSKIKTIFYTAGFSVSHVTRPSESFYNKLITPRQPLKFTLHGDMKIPLGDRYSIGPQFMYSSTSGTREFIGGAVGSFYPHDNSMGIHKIYSLLMIRINPPENVDAMIIGAGTYYHSLDLCLSYDLTVSALRKAPQVQGAFELSLIYNLTWQKPESDNPPCFMF